jgi:hypothetical protein
LAIAELGVFGWVQPVKLRDVGIDAGPHVLTLERAAEHVFEYPADDIASMGIVLRDHGTNSVIVVVLFSNDIVLDLAPSTQLPPAVAVFRGIGYQPAEF